MPTAKHRRGAARGRLHFTLPALGLAVGAAACGGPGGLEEARHPTGSSALATAQGYSALYIANAAEDSVSRVQVGGGVQEIALPGEPTRVARAGDRVFVTLRAQRALAVLRDDGGALSLERTVALGAEPMGVVADEAGARLYVASGLSNRVDELDASTLAVLRTWTVPDEPRWLALHPDGTLYVASAWQGTLTWIELGSGDVHTSRLPDRNVFVNQTGDEQAMSARITGDPAVSPDGRFLVVPALYLDNHNPIASPNDDGSGGIRQSETGGYSGDRFNAVVAVVPLAGRGKPKLGDTDLVQVTSFNREVPAVGYPASVTVDPESKIILATIEGSAAVVVVPLEAPEEGGLFDNLFDDVGFNAFSFRIQEVFNTAQGPRAVAFTSGQDAFVYSFLDRTVERLDAEAARSAVVGDQAGARFFFGGRPTTDQLRVSQAVLTPDVEAGRRLFYSATDSRMSQQGSGVSCATCHFDGRTDGLTWTFDTGVRQTPSLAGKVSETEPVRWEGDRATVAEDALFTSQGLMGGSGIQDADLVAVAAFIDWVREVDTPNKGADLDAVRRGEAIFARSDVGCATCHSGARYTDHTTYPMFGLRAVQTRSLTGLAGSPPYLHDGSAPSVRALLERLRGGEMGSTAALSDAELDDLEAFLLSL
jgi:mono/diheme cytochrome c family protein